MGEWNSVDRLADRLTELHVPQFCKKCGGAMKFRGVGEYMCEHCGFLQYDDYGKVRNGLESFPGMTIAETEQRTGVSQRTIRKLLKEGRIMLTEDSKVMLSCEKCGKKIRFGRLCENCEQAEKKSRKIDHDAVPVHSSMYGFVTTNNENAKGKKRFQQND